MNYAQNSKQQTEPDGFKAVYFDEMAHCAHFSLNDLNFDSHI